MSDGSRDQQAESTSERRRRLDSIFGDVLPDTTSDERDEDGAGRRTPTSGDDWLRDQVPPHHG